MNQQRCRRAISRRTQILSLCLDAALPPSSAVRLCLTETALSKLKEARPPILDSRRSLNSKLSYPVRLSLTALEGGKAAQDVDGSSVL